MQRQQANCVEKYEGYKNNIIEKILVKLIEP